MDQIGHKRIKVKVHDKTRRLQWSGHVLEMLNNSPVKMVLDNRLASRIYQIEDDLRNLLKVKESNTWLGTAVESAIQ